MNENDLQIMNQLPDKEIYLNANSVSDLCSTWTSRVSGFNLTSERITGEFSELSSYGILENYIVCLATAVNSLTSTVNSVSKAINNMNGGQMNIDYHYTSYNVTSDYYAVNEGKNQDTSSETIADNSKEDASITPGDLTEEIVQIDYTIIRSEIYDIFNKDPDLFTETLSEEQINKIKKQLLSSVNLSEEQKQIIANTDFSILEISIKNIVKESISNISDIQNKEFLYMFIEQRAKQNNLTASELINNASNSSLIKEAVIDYTKTMEYLDNSSKDGSIMFRNDLLDLFDGNKIGQIDKEIVSSVRNIVESFSEKQGLSAEDFIDSGSLKGEIGYYSKIKNDMTILQSMPSDKLQGLIKNIYR